MPPTPFPAGKTIKELGIDTTRKFVVVGRWPGDTTKVGQILTLKDDDSTVFPLLLDEDGGTQCCHISSLAYYEPTEPEAWEPKIGDKVAVEATVTCVGRGTALYGNATVDVLINNDVDLIAIPWKVIKLISPAPPRKVTRKEIEEALGSTFEIIED